jgi:hypothetical protein
MSELPADLSGIDEAIVAIVPEHHRPLVYDALKLDSQSLPDFDKIGLSLTGENRNTGLLWNTGAPSGAATKSAWGYIKAELYDYFCTSSKKYAKERNDANATMTSLITVIATAVASTLGVAIGVVAGAVTVALISVVRIGKNAWCAANKA